MSVSLNLENECKNLVAVSAAIDAQYRATLHGQLIRLVHFGQKFSKSRYDIEQERLSCSLPNGEEWVFKTTLDKVCIAKVFAKLDPLYDLESNGSLTHKWKVDKKRKYRQEFMGHFGVESNMEPLLDRQSVL